MPHHPDLRHHGISPTSAPPEGGESPLPELPPSAEIGDLRARKHRGPGEPGGRGDRGIGGNRKRE